MIQDKQKKSIVSAKNLFGIFCALVLFIPSFSSASLTDGLVGYWTMNGADINWDTNTMTDRSSGGTVATLVNMSTTSASVLGRLGQGMSFNGGNSYVQMNQIVVGPSFSGGIGSMLFSVSFWVYTDFSQCQQPAIARDTNASTKVFDIYINTGPGQSCSNGDVAIATINGVGAYTIAGTANQALKKNQWNHVVVNFNTTTMSLYINGVLQSLNDSTIYGSGLGTPLLTLGTYRALSFFKGSLDDVRFYNRTLSSTEITQLYKQGQGTIAASPRVATSTSATGLSNGLVGYWTLDGKNTNWRTNTTSDSSGNNNTGTLNNMSTTTSGVLGKIGQGFFFNGQSSSASNVNIPSSSSLQFSGAVPITLSAWVYPTQNSTYGTFLVKGRESNDGAANYAFRQDSTGKKLEFYYNDAGSATWQVWITSANVFPTTNKWYHVVVTDTIGTGSSIVAYINGQPVSGTWSGGTGNVTADVDSQAVTLGWKANSGGTNEQFKGILDDVRIYNRILSQAEVTQLYKQGGGTIAASPRVATSTSATGLSNGLVGYWTMDGKDINWVSKTMVDKSGSNNTASLASLSTTTSPTLGKLGQAFYFPGQGNQNVSVPDSSSLTTTASTTFSAWINTSSLVTRQVILAKTANSNNTWLIDIDPADCGNGKIEVFMDTSATGQSITCSTTALNINQWYLITVVYNQKDVRIYVNGNLDKISLSTIGGAIATNSLPITIGDWSSNNRPFMGLIDDVRIYNRALSAVEIVQLYKQGTSKIR